MPSYFRTSDPAFRSRFDTFVARRRDGADDIQESVKEILAAVRERGDEALFGFASRFDGSAINAGTVRVPAADLAEAFGGLSDILRDSLTLAHDRIAAHHRRQLPVNDSYRDSVGAELGSRWNAIESVGLYVPGGKASYPSSLLMNAVPAKVAGVPRIVMVVPSPGGVINPIVLAAAHLAGVHEVYRVGGAHAVAALAYGTQSIAPVAKIVGPGNAYVAEAKRQVFGVVGIDTIAGPSEVLVVADGSANSRWVSADLLAQAEHDEGAQSILITDNETFAADVALSLERQLAGMPREEIASKSWEAHGAIVIVSDIVSEAPSLIDSLAPEHLELACADADVMIPLIRNAGAIFVGHLTPEAIGDYVAGSNHVLPTSRAARFASGLSVLDFMKRTSILKLDAHALAALGPAAIELATAENLYGHANSVQLRLDTMR